MSNDIAYSIIKSFEAKYGGIRGVRLASIKMLIPKKEFDNYMSARDSLGL